MVVQKLPPLALNGYVTIKNSLIVHEQNTKGNHSCKESLICDKAHTYFYKIFASILLAYTTSILKIFSQTLNSVLYLIKHSCPYNKYIKITFS